VQCFSVMLDIRCISAMETVAHFSKSISDYSDVSAVQEEHEILEKLQKRI